MTEELKKQKKINMFLVVFLLVLLVMNIVALSRTRRISVDDYGVASIESKVSVRIQESGTGAGLRVENERVIVDSNGGLIVGGDVVFLGGVFTQENRGFSGAVSVCESVLEFDNGLFVGSSKE